MRINSQLLRNRAKVRSLQLIEYVDLSHLGLCIIEKLGHCKRLQTLNLSHNDIESVSTNIELCPELWNINLANNRIRSLDGFRRFVSIGTLNLANNKLMWSELNKIQHLHIMDLHLHGNSELEKDPYYRIHVIDCLPHVWMLDGRQITSAERILVKMFFEDSAGSDKPVRHRLAAVKGFIPTHQQNRRVNGIFGSKTIGLMTKFPESEASNVSLDIRRLLFLARNVASDLQLEDRCMTRKFEAVKFNEHFLEELLDIRKNDLQKGNMFLVLLLASLEFTIPDELFKETLEITKLDRIGTVYTIDIFLLPPEKRTLIACVLLSSVKIERVENKTGGLYDRLYLCMNYLITEAVKTNAGAKTQHTSNPMHRKYRSLLAAEVVLLMCYVLTFVEYIQKEPGIMSLVSSATCDTQIVSRIMHLREQLALQQQGQDSIAEAVGHFVQAAVLFHLNKKTENNKLQPEEKLFSKKPLPRRPMSGPIFSSNYHTRGQSSPDMKPTRVTSARPKRNRVPEIGDTVLVGPQSLAQIVSLPQPDIALLLLEMILVNGAMRSRVNSFEEHYAYIDASALRWDTVKSFWRPKGTVGDRLTMHYVEDEKVSIDTLDLGYAGPKPTALSPVFIPKAELDAMSTTTSKTGITVPHSAELMCITPARHLSAGHNSPEPENILSESSLERRLANQVDNLPRPNFLLSEEAVAAAVVIEEIQAPVTKQTLEQPVIPETEELDIEILNNEFSHVETTIDETTIDETVIDETLNDGIVTKNITQSKQQGSDGGSAQELEDVLPEQQSHEDIVEDTNNNNASMILKVYPVDVDHLNQQKSGSRSSSAQGQRSLKSAGVQLPSTRMSEISAIERENSVVDLDTDLDDLEEELTHLVTDESAAAFVPVSVDLSHDIPSRVGAPTNSPDLSQIRTHSSAEKVNLQRTPSAKITSLHDMIKLNDPRYTASTPTGRETRSKSQIVATEDESTTPYLRKRTDAWNVRILDNAYTEARCFIPPDPYDYYSRGAVTPSASAIESAVHGPAIRWGNLWMAGGRDLHYEEMLKRPSSAHVPGWRDGLKGSAPIKSNRKRVGAQSACPVAYRHMMNSTKGVRQHQSAVSSVDPVNTSRRWPSQSAQGIRSSYLKSASNMRDDSQLKKHLRVAAWTAYIDQIQFNQHQQAEN